MIEAIVVTLFLMYAGGVALALLGFFVADKFDLDINNYTMNIGFYVLATIRTLFYASAVICVIYYIVSYLGAL